MNRLVLIGLAGLVVVLIVLGTVLSVTAPPAVDERLLRGRVLLNSDNYLGVVEMLRDTPGGRSSAEAHAYLGLAYMRLHLYLAAIREFEQAIEKGAGNARADANIGLASTYFQLRDGPKALEHARLATEQNPDAADAWITLGRAHWLMRNFAEAETAGLKASGLDPEHPVVPELLLHIYFDSNEPGKFQSTLDRLPAPPKPVHDLALQFYVRQGQWSKAYDARVRFQRMDIERSIMESELALKREPRRTDLYPALVRNLVQTGRYADAIDAANRYDGDVSLDLEVAKALWMTGEPALAARDLEAASRALVHKLSAEVGLAVLTGNIRHWRQAYQAEHVEQDYFILARLEKKLAEASEMERGFIFRYAGVYDATFYTQAAEEALKVLDRDVDNLDALMTIATAYHRLGRVDDAMRYVQQASRVYPSNDEVWSRMANLYIAKGDSQKVAEYMQRAVELAPRNPGHLYNLGWLYDQLGEVSQATELYERAIEASALSFEAMNNLALLYAAGGQSDRALRLLEQATRVDSESEAAFLNLASHYSRLRDWKQALAGFERVLQINPANALAAVEKGRIQLELGRIDRAVESLNHALEVDSGAFDAYILLSSAYERMGHTREAVAAAEEAARITPSAEEVRTILDRLRQPEGIPQS